MGSLQPLGHPRCRRGDSAGSLGARPHSSTRALGAGRRERGRRWDGGHCFQAGSLYIWSINPIPQETAPPHAPSSVQAGEAERSVQEPTRPAPPGRKEVAGRAGNDTSQAMNAGAEVAGGVRQVLPSWPQRGDVGRNARAETAPRAEAPPPPRLITGLLGHNDA